MNQQKTKHGFTSEEAQAIIGEALQGGGVDTPLRSQLREEAAKRDAASKRLELARQTLKATEAAFEQSKGAVDALANAVLSEAAAAAVKTTEIPVEPPPKNGASKSVSPAA